MNDKGETAKEGSLLVAKHGKGYYVYTGLSFFREFPAGVSGAYRLFANMLIIGKNELSNQTKRLLYHGKTSQKWSKMYTLVLVAQCYLYHCILLYN